MHNKSYVNQTSDLAGIQTLDLQNRNLTLYSAKLRGPIVSAKVNNINGITPMKVLKNEYCHLSERLSKHGKTKPTSGSIIKGRILLFLNDCNRRAYTIRSQRECCRTLLSCFVFRQYKVDFMCFIGTKGQTFIRITIIGLLCCQPFL